MQGLRIKHKQPFNTIYDHHDSNNLFLVIFLSMQIKKKEPQILERVCGTWNEMRSFSFSRIPLFPCYRYPHDNILQAIIKKQQKKLLMYHGPNINMYHVICG